MMERRPFPPSPRRLALARQAGLTAASPLVVGAVACVATIALAIALARAAAERIGAWIATACRAADGTLTPDLRIDDVATSVIALVAPLVLAAAVAAIVAHVTQTRALWLPRRRVAGAPLPEPARVRRTAFDITAATVIGVVAFAWLWLTAPRLARLFSVETVLPAVGSAIASLVVALAIAWLGIAMLDALFRRFELARALAMTVAEKREDDRIAAADPRWQKQRALLARAPSASSAVARAAVVVLGDDIAVAIAWEPRRQPVPIRTITGRRAHATQLVGLARRHRVPVHRDAQLALALEGEGPVPDSDWARLAEIIAAVRSAGILVSRP
jgi:type III secretory pathway component EscU